MFQKNILLALSVLLLGFVSFPKADAPYKLSGIVVDDSGNPLIGASILVKGTTIGAVSDVDGKFNIAVPDSCTNLVVSYTGFTTVEKKACAGDPARIVLYSSLSLQEMVVTGYGVQRKKEATGAISNSVKIRGSATKSALGSVATPSYIGNNRVASPQPNFNTEDYDRVQENRFHRATQEPQSTFSIDVDAASYSNLRRFINNGQKPPEDAVRIEEMINYFDYEYAEPTGKHPFSINTEVSDCPWQPKHRLVHIGLQGKHTPSENLPAANLVFLIDVSGSMSAANKLPLVQTSFKLLAEQLRPQDRVAIVVYAGAAGLVLEPTTGDKKPKSRKPSINSRLAALPQVAKASVWLTKLLKNTSSKVATTA